MDVITEELSVEDRINQATDEITVGFKKEIAGLNRKNLDLQKTLEAKAVEGKSVEERIAAIEMDRTAANLRADTVEAFAKAGLSDDWRVAMDTKSPGERADAVKALIESERAKASEELAKEFTANPDKHLDGSNRTFTAEQLRGKSAEEINALWSAGRIAGVQS